MYKSSKLTTCSACKGTGFIKNIMRHIYYNNTNINEDLENKTPYICCNFCKGTGKHDYNKVFNLIYGHE
jgi:RecJ-like exonuclease